MFRVHNEIEFEKARIGLHVTSDEIAQETRVMVTDIYVEAYKYLRHFTPVGNFQDGATGGNLHQSIYFDKNATPIKDIGGTGQFIRGGSWEGRAGFSRRSATQFRLRRLQTPAGHFPQTDPPIEYVLAVNDGRKPMFKADGYFAWYDHRKPAKRKSTHGYNVFTRVMGARFGQHFIEKAQAATDLYSEKKVREFMRIKGRTSAATREAKLTAILGNATGNFNSI